VVQLALLFAGGASCHRVGVEGFPLSSQRPCLATCNSPPYYPVVADRLG